MIPENRIPTHPSVILSQEFLGPLGVSHVASAPHLRVPVQRINEIVRGKRGITPETAWPPSHSAPPRHHSSFLTRTLHLPQCPPLWHRAGAVGGE